MNRTNSRQLAMISLTLLLIGVALLTALLWGWPRYRVYAADMRGRAALAEAENSRQVAVREALALKDSARYKAEAEVIRANGVAQANKIVASGLGGPEGYLRYLAIQAMKEQAQGQNATTVYVATEAGIPITEASRFNKPLPATPND